MFDGIKKSPLLPTKPRPQSIGIGVFIHDKTQF